MTEIVDIEIGTTPKIITKETNHGLTMKETDPLAEKDHMIETIHTVAMIQIDPIKKMIHIAEKEHMTEINHTIETDHIVGIGQETTIKTTI